MKLSTTNKTSFHIKALNSVKKRFHCAVINSAEEKKHF